jgi:hypothetical protein
MDVLKRVFSFVGNIINHVFACLDKKWHLTIKFVSNYINKKTKNKLATMWKLNQVAIPSDFILRTRSNKLVTSIIFTSQVAQAFATLDTQSKIIFNDGHLHLAPNMVVELSIYPLHLTRMACELTQW